MSANFTTVWTTTVENNWNAVAANGTRTDGQVAIDLTASDGESLFFNFLISCPGKNKSKPCQGHVTLKYGANPAHVTLLGWDGGKKVNYWYSVEPNLTVKDGKPPPGMKSEIQGTSVGISSMPGAINGAIVRLIQELYTGAFYT